MSNPFVFESTPAVPGSRPTGHSGHAPSLSLGSAAPFQAAQRESGSASPAMFGQQQQQQSPVQQQQQPQQPSQAPLGQAGAPQDASAPSPVPGGPQREGPTRRGVCKFFNSQKGFGFVLDNKAEELGGQEVFVHFTAIQSKTGFRSLAEGEEVEYEITTGPKGFQAVRLTGPGGRPVIGDPKARMMKNAPVMQLAPMPFAHYGMDPYQQHPGAVYTASPYASQIVYVPQAMHPQQAQYAQMMGAGAASSPQFSPQMASFAPGAPGAGPNGRQALMAQQQAQPQSSMPSAGPAGVPGGFQQQQQTGGPFGPVAGAQAGGNAGFSNAGPRYGAGAPNPGQGSFGNMGLSGGSTSPSAGVFGNPGLGLNPNRAEDAGQNPPQSAFYGSGNLLYSSN